MKKWKSPYPPECPLVLCGCCLDSGQSIVVELTGEVLHYIYGKPHPERPDEIYNGDSVVEFRGVEHYDGETASHGAIEPVPLTKFAAELLRALKTETVAKRVKWRP
jgi:hypothetical protein